MHKSYSLYAIMLFLGFSVSCSSSIGQSNQSKGSEVVIAFGSCNKPSVDGKMWPEISKNNPDLFVWLGDIIYGDTENMNKLQAKYQEQSDQPDYQEFIKTTPVIGIWDDHDYGVNDGGKEFSEKAASKEVLFNFLNVGKEDEVWNREGAYSSTTIGEKNQQIKIILLDGRYFRDELIKSKEEGKKYGANPTGDILGEAQWEWLEKELANSTAKVHIIGCGIQFIPEEHGWEKWANFPTARNRFFKLLEKTVPKNTILVSGDRHIAEFSKISLPGFKEPVYEVTASGLTHTWSNPGEEANKYREGDLIVKRNFGLVKVKWSEKNNPSVTLEVRGLGNELFLNQKL